MNSSQRRKESDVVLNRMKLQERINAGVEEVIIVILHCTHI